MPTPITILHLSDFQFGKNHHFGRLKLEPPATSSRSEQCGNLRYGGNCFSPVRSVDVSRCSLFIAFRSAPIEMPANSPSFNEALNLRPRWSAVAVPIMIRL
jgi:hypothetical protein